MSLPIHVARCNAVRIPVYRNGAGRYGITWRSVAGGKRIRETFGSRAAAITRADAIALAVHNGQADALVLTPNDRADYQAALATLAPLGIPLHAAVAEYAAARKAIGAHTLTEAANFFARGHAERRTCPDTAQIVRELTASLRNRRHRPVTPKTLGPLLTRLAACARAFPSLPDASPTALAQWLDSLTTHRGQPIAAKTRDHFRDALRQLYTFAQARGYLAPGRTPASDLERVWQPAGVETYSPAELRAILATAPKAWIPFIALGAFAGLRTSEIYRLRWEHFRWEEEFIALSAHVAAKTFRPRHVPILPALTAWLAPYRRTFGSLYPQPTLDKFESALDRLTAYLREHIEGFRWKQNALRHSYVSHRLAATQNPQIVRMEAGHTEAMQQRHYNDPKTPREAAAYFAILPPWGADGIVAIAGV